MRWISRLLILTSVVMVLGVSLILVEAPAMMDSLTRTTQLQSGFGGAYSTNQPAGRMYGGLGPDGSCLGTSGDIVHMLAFDFGWDQSRITAFVQSKWLRGTTDQLCNDGWIWDLATTLPIHQVVQQLQWPTDLINPEWANQSVSLRPLSTFDPRTLQAQQNLRNNGTPGQGLMYGGSGTNGSCLGTSGSVTRMLTFDFGWDKTMLSTAIASKWLGDAKSNLCNDNYFWEAPIQLPAQQVIQQLQWPVDLLNPSFQTQPLTLRPLSTFDMKTVNAQQAAQQGSSQPTGPCDWVIRVLFAYVHIDLCAPLRLLVAAGDEAIRGIYNSISSQLNFLWTTPTTPFTDGKVGLLDVWSISWGIMLLGIVAVVAWASLRYMVGSSISWLAYAHLVELIPRLLLGLLAALYSKQFFLMLIHFNNALSAVFVCNTPSGLNECLRDPLATAINGHTSGLITGILQIVYGIMSFLLILEEAARTAVVYLLFAFSPILFFLVALRETERWAKGAAFAAILFILLQALQAATLSVGQRVLDNVLHGNANQLVFLNLLVTIAILYLTLLLFFSITRLAFSFAGGPLALAPFERSLGLGTLGARGFWRQARSLGGVTRWTMGRAFGEQERSQDGSGPGGNHSGGGGSGREGSPLKVSFPSGRGHMQPAGGRQTPLAAPTNIPVQPGTKGQPGFQAHPAPSTNRTRPGGIIPARPVIRPTQPVRKVAPPRKITLQRIPTQRGNDETTPPPQN